MRRKAFLANVQQILRDSSLPDVQSHDSSLSSISSFDMLSVTSPPLLLLLVLILCKTKSNTSGISHGLR